MADKTSQVPSEPNQPLSPVNEAHPAQLHPSIMNQTLGQILQNNKQARGMILKSMNINEEQFQQMLHSTGDNQYMNMTIGELFKSGFIKQAMSQQAQAKKIVGAPLPQGFAGQAQPGQAVQLSPEQLQQMMGGQQGQVVQMTPEQLQQVMSQQNVQVVQGNAQGQPMQVVMQPQKQSFFQKVKGLFS